MATNNFAALHSQCVTKFSGSYTEAVSKTEDRKFCEQRLERMMSTKLRRMLEGAQGPISGKLQPQQLQTSSETNVNEVQAGILSSPRRNQDLSRLWIVPEGVIPLGRGKEARKETLMSLLWAENQKK